MAKRERNEQLNVSARQQLERRPCLLKPGSHEQHKHKHNTNTKTKHDLSSETCEDKTTRIFHCFAFCSALGLCLDYDLMLMTILMTSFPCFAFCFAFMLMLSCEPGFSFQARDHTHLISSRFIQNS